MSRPPKAIIEYRKYDLPLTFPVLLLDGNRWNISDWVSDRLHFHNCLEIGICHSGSGTMVFEGKEVPFKGGYTTCVPRHIPHTTYSDPGTNSLWSYIFVNLRQLFLELFHNSTLDLVMPTAAFESTRYLMDQDHYPKIHFLVTCILDELRAEKPNYQAAVRGLFLSLYIELLRIQEEAPQTESIDTTSSNTLSIYPALNYIYQNYMNPFSIDDLAELCHLSTTHFRRVFQEIIGTSPQYFINATRIDEACTLLQTTNRSILSISELVGFRTLSSFNRYFVKLMGMTPREYRNPTNRPQERPERKSILEYSGWL